MKKIVLLLTLILMCLPISSVLAEEEVSEINEKLSAYKNVLMINDLDLQVPTVVELPLDNFYKRYHDFAVLEVETDSFQANYLNVIGEDISVDISTEPDKKNINNLIDNNRNTFVEYSLIDDSFSVANIVIEGDSPITSSSLLTQLDRYVSLPTAIEISTLENENKNIVFTKGDIKSQILYFPKTTAKTWNIKYEYSQPLRITELRLLQEQSTKSLTSSLRFLARPNMTYKIYSDSDRDSDIEVPESGNLSDNKEVLKLDQIKIQDNLFYLRSDIDEDNIPDEFDNCVKIANSNQEDINNNKRGDACDDFDRDGIINAEDNCPDTPNYRQKDIDADDIGDVCDDSESRITESKPWLPWVAISFVILLIGFLFVRTVKK